MGEYTQFCGKHGVLFGTELLSRGLDFDNSVDWVVQVSQCFFKEAKFTGFLLLI